ncbi:DVUA0089 family protein [Sphingomonas glaciei]|uniref:DVUA0089 family protein n=1 Tax=Sphingomonas glaciei TaxID=2938948 RepID=A0ABY5MW68_9SPHN|nr:DVUA0089 family protein [Sphingomonas glaciei]UUR07368.1 DVUA0089 family protein [Sphingomonas glaciei]
MGKFLALSAAAALLTSAAPAAAADFSYAGTLAGPNSVQLTTFVVGSPSTVTFRTYSFAGGTNAAGTVIGRGGFDPILTLFDSNGLLIDENDDGESNVGTDPLTSERADSFLRALLGPGSYTVALSAFSNFANGPNLSNGFENDGSFDGRSSAYAFDILGVNSAVQVGAVPEPGTWALMLVGFGAIGASLRRRRRVIAVAAAT